MMEPLTKEWAEGALKAVRATIDKYENNDYEDDGEGCPFCTFDFINGDCCSCSICPWTIFEKQRCIDADYRSDPIPLRLHRLRGWEKRLINILGRSDL